VRTKRVSDDGRTASCNNQKKKANNKPPRHSSLFEQCSGFLQTFSSRSTTYKKYIQNMTSLQRLSRKGGTLEVKNGAFESSFATGLDLSEFVGVVVCSSKKQQRSAAAELLRIKAEQAHQDTNEEREERWIHKVAKARGKQLLQAAVVHNYSNDEFGSCRQHAAPPPLESQQQSATDLMDKTDIGATLVYMHGEDANGVHHKAKYKTKGTKRSLEKSLRRKGTSTKEKGVKKQPAVKTSTRSKY
jgi:hypothetical protein